MAAVLRPKSRKSKPPVQLGHVEASGKTTVDKDTPEFKKNETDLRSFMDGYYHGALCQQPSWSEFDADIRGVRSLVSIAVADDQLLLNYLSLIVIEYLSIVSTNSFESADALFGKEPDTWAVAANESNEAKVEALDELAFYYVTAGRNSVNEHPPDIHPDWAF